MQTRIRWPKVPRDLQLKKTVPISSVKLNLGLSNIESKKKKKLSESLTDMCMYQST